MTLDFSQAFQEHASNGVSLWVDRALVVTVGRGESATVELPDGLHMVEVRCGCYFRRMELTASCSITVRWILKPPDMEVIVTGV